MNGILALPRSTNIGLAVHQLKEGLNCIEQLAEILTESGVEHHINTVGAIAPHIAYLEEAVKYVDEWVQDNVAKADITPKGLSSDEAAFLRNFRKATAVHKTLLLALSEQL